MSKARISEPRLELLFRALADSTRLRLLNLIGDREICVCYFVEILGMSQPKISRHLAYLRNAGIVSVRREGKWIHYRLAQPEDSVVAGILHDTLGYLREKPEMQRDVARLGAACCQPQKSELLLGAPLPRGLEPAAKLPPALADELQAKISKWVDSHR